MPDVVHPALYPRNLFPSSNITLFWQTKKSPQLANRAPIVPSGGTLGGGSAMNWMVYTRGQRSDFDSWNTEGWSADELLPFLKKVGLLSGLCCQSLITSQLETYHGKGDKDRHGFEGPVNVSVRIFPSIFFSFRDAAGFLSHFFEAKGTFELSDILVWCYLASDASSLIRSL